MYLTELNGDIFEVSWDRYGKRVAVAYSTGKVRLVPTHTAFEVIAR